MKSALFVDFDNVYSGLRKLDPASADRFARKPGEWMTWLIESLGLPEHSPADAKRRVLVRRCYLNPQAYQRFRPSFNLAGFEIVDCPALTSEGKTSTDTSDEGGNDAATLGKKLADNVRSLCLREQMAIDSATNAAIDAWISCGS